jgi:hypothetical protein
LSSSTSSGSSEVGYGSTPVAGKQLFMRYFTAVLIDLTVLGVFAEHWDGGI